MAKYITRVGVLGLLVAFTLGGLSASPRGKPLRFIFIAPLIKEAFFGPVKKGMNDAARMMGVSCTFTGTEDVNVVKQAEMVKQAIDQGYDGIALDIIDPVAFDEVAQLAADRGIPLVAFNVDDNATPNARLSAVCQNLYQAGQTTGTQAAPFIAPNSQILMTMHDEGVSALEDRLHGAQEVLKDKGVTWKVIITGSTAEASAGVVAKALKENPDIKVVLCTGQADTEGAGLAIEREFKGGGYWAAGYDLSSQTLRLIKAGVIRFTIDQQPYIQGFYPVVQLALRCRYGIAPSSIDAGAAVISAANVAVVSELCRKGYR